MNVAILGNGGFGSALAIVLGRDHRVRLWGHDRAYTQEVARTRHNPRYLSRATLPESIVVTTEFDEVFAGAEVILAAVPTQHVRAVAQQAAPRMSSDVPIVSLAKGLEQLSGRRPSEVLVEVCGGTREVLVLSGPSHAEELALGLPATVVLAGGDVACLERLQSELSGPALRIYRNSDVLGVELCGALKNVMALAAGIADGLGFGDNAKAAVLARGLVEMARYGEVEGARRETFYGLAGVGDLAVTAFSRHGRNRAFGERIGRGEAMADILASSPKVVEGVWTARAVRERSRSLGIEMPLCEAVCDVLYDGAAPRSAVSALMTRDPKEEA
ncbi:MAG: NAD(P)H-dependent glycerol-3-phosphate dehydrogenase [Planctomycetota bacterium]